MGRVPVCKLFVTVVFVASVVYAVYGIGHRGLVSSSSFLPLPSIVSIVTSIARTSHTLGLTLPKHLGNRTRSEPRASLVCHVLLTLHFWLSRELPHSGAKTHETNRVTNALFTETCHTSSNAVALPILHPAFTRRSSPCI